MPKEVLIALHKTNLKAFEVGKSLMQYVKNASSRRIESLKIKKMKEDDKVNEKQPLARELLELTAQKRSIEEVRNEELSNLGKNIQSVKKKMRRT